jgi:transketolase
LYKKEPSAFTTNSNPLLFPTKDLLTLNKNGTNLPSHCDMLKTPGIDMTAGSLGQGLSAAIGMAMAAKMDKKSIRVYSIVARCVRRIVRVRKVRSFQC